MPRKKVREFFHDPLLPREARSRRGNVYQLGRHRLMCGDATSEDDVAALMNGAKADLVFTDPPYNVGYIGKTPRSLRIKNDKMRNDRFRTLLRDAFSRLASHTKDGSGIYVCHAAMRTDAFAAALRDTGWYTAQCLVWVKHHFVLGLADYHWKHEPILYGWKAGAPHRWYSDRKQTTVWCFDRPMRNAEHPTMKPIPLIVRAIENSSQLDDLVLDTFAGSGSTLIAAEQTGRTAYVMELDAQYCDVIRLRYARERQ
jgi:DNA modification methylase